MIKGGYTPEKKLDLSKLPPKKKGLKSIRRVEANFSINLILRENEADER